MSTTKRKLNENYWIRFILPVFIASAAIFIWLYDFLPYVIERDSRKKEITQLENHIFLLQNEVLTWKNQRQEIINQRISDSLSIIADSLIREVGKVAQAYNNISSSYEALSSQYNDASKQLEAKIKSEKFTNDALRVSGFVKADEVINQLINNPNRPLKPSEWEKILKAHQEQEDYLYSTLSNTTMIIHWTDFFFNGTKFDKSRWGNRGKANDLKSYMEKYRGQATIYCAYHNKEGRIVSWAQYEPDILYYKDEKQAIVANIIAKTYSEIIKGVKIGAESADFRIIFGDQKVVDSLTVK